MSGTWGNAIKFTIFGESHGVAIGGVLDGIPAGTKIDFDKIDVEMKRRNHRSFFSTARDEKDEYEVLSGVLGNVAAGSPIAFIIRNKDQKSSDYLNLNVTPRPGHADYPAAVKFSGYNDYRGGGHFSGRITAPLTFAGSVARQILEKKGVFIASHISSIGTVQDCGFLDFPLKSDSIKKLHDMEIPVIDAKAGEKMAEKIKRHKEDCNSVGGVIECAVCGVPAGIGSPFFESVESALAAMMFSIPAVKGIEFGKGFEITHMSGFEANDNYVVKDGKVEALSNNNGGVLGGITNGMPIIFRVAIKPTPSVFKTQKTVNLETMENTEITLKGRHDSCIVPRAVAVVEAAAALVIADLDMRFGKREQV